MHSKKILFLLLLFQPLFAKEEGFFQSDSFVIFLQIIIPIILLFFLVYIFVEATEKKEKILSSRESVFSPIEDETTLNVSYSVEFKNYFFPIAKDLLNRLIFNHVKLYIFIGDKYNGLALKKGNLIIKMEDENDTINIGLETDSVLKKGYIALKGDIFYIPLIFENELLSILSIEQTNNEEIEKHWESICFESETFLEKVKYYEIIVHKKTNLYNLFYFYTYIKNVTAENLLICLKIHSLIEDYTNIIFWLTDYIRNKFDDKIKNFYLISESLVVFELPESLWVDFTSVLPNLMDELNSVYDNTSINIGAAKPEISGGLWYQKSREALKQSIQKGKNNYTII